MVYLILLGLMPAVQAEPDDVWNSCQIAVENITENMRSIAERIDQIPDDGVVVQQFDAKIVDPSMVLEPLSELSCPEIAAKAMPKNLKRHFEDFFEDAESTFDENIDASELLVQLHSRAQIRLDAKLESTLRAKRKQNLQKEY